MAPLETPLLIRYRTDIARGIGLEVRLDRCQGRDRDGSGQHRGSAKVTERGLKWLACPVQPTAATLRGAPDGVRQHAHSSGSEHPFQQLSGTRHMARGDVRIAATLACEDCKRRNYQTNKSKRNNPERLQLRKYCKWCKRHTAHRETR